MALRRSGGAAGEQEPCSQRGWATTFGGTGCVGGLSDRNCSSSQEKRVWLFPPQRCRGLAQKRISSKPELKSSCWVQPRRKPLKPGRNGDRDTPCSCPFHWHHHSKVGDTQVGASSGVQTRLMGPPNTTCAVLWNLHCNTSSFPSQPWTHLTRKEWESRVAGTYSQSKINYSLSVLY